MTKGAPLKRKLKMERLARIAEAHKKNDTPKKPRVTDKKKMGIATPKMPKNKKSALGVMFPDHMESKKARMKKIHRMGPKIVLQEEKALKGVK